MGDQLLHECVLYPHKIPSLGTQRERREFRREVERYKEDILRFRTTVVKQGDTPSRKLVKTICPGQYHNAYEHAEEKQRNLRRACGSRAITHSVDTSLAFLGCGLIYYELDDSISSSLASVDDSLRWVHGRANNTRIGGRVIAGLGRIVRTVRGLDEVENPAGSIFSGLDRNLRKVYEPQREEENSGKIFANLIGLDRKKYLDDYMTTAVLHDAVEDVSKTFGELERNLDEVEDLFGSEIAHNIDILSNGYNIIAKYVKDTAKEFSVKKVREVDLSYVEKSLSRYNEGDDLLDVEEAVVKLKRKYLTQVNSKLSKIRKGKKNGLDLTDLDAAIDNVVRIGGDLSSLEEAIGRIDSKYQNFATGLKEEVDGIKNKYVEISRIEEKIVEARLGDEGTRERSIEGIETVVREIKREYLDKYVDVTPIETVLRELELSIGASVSERKKDQYKKMVGQVRTRLHELRNELLDENQNSWHEVNLFEAVKLGCYELYCDRIFRDAVKRYIDNDVKFDTCVLVKTADSMDNVATMEAAHKIKIKSTVIKAEIFEKYLEDFRDFIGAQEGTYSGIANNAPEDYCSLLTDLDSVYKLCIVKSLEERNRSSRSLIHPRYMTSIVPKLDDLVDKYRGKFEVHGRVEGRSPYSIAA
jgi:hypothetical protein